MQGSPDLRLKMTSYFKNSGWNKPLLLLLGPALLLMIFFFVIPMITIGSTSFSAGSTGELKFTGFTVENYAKFFKSKFYVYTLLRTFRLGIWVTVFSFLIGYPLSYYMIRVVTSKKWRRLIYIIVVAPLFTSAIVRSFGWIVILGRKGCLNDLLMFFGILDAPAQFLYTEGGVIIGLVHILVPFMVLTVTSVLQNIQMSVEEAAQDLGANRFQTFLRVTFPLSFPGVIAGSLIVFTLAVSAYVTPSILSGGKLNVLSMLIFEQFMSVFNWSFGSALACILLFCTMVLVMIYWRIMGQQIKGV